MQTKTYNPAFVHQVLSEMAWERVREFYPAQAPKAVGEMTAEELLRIHVLVMGRILGNQNDYQELWRRVRQRVNDEPTP